MSQNRRGTRSKDAALQESEQLIAGRNPVLEALRSENLPDAVYLSGNSGVLRQISDLAREKGIPVKTVSDAKLSLMTGNANHQGAAASGSCGTYVSIEEILQAAADKNEPPLIVICDEIQDPHNLGAIIRTAEAAGVHGIIIPKRRSASLNLTVGKTSAGAVEYMPVARVTNIARTIEELKKEGIWVACADMGGDEHFDASLDGAIALVLGSEGDGVSRLVKEKCDFVVSIPMYGKISSLNASVAASLLMYEVVRQRNYK